MHHAEVYETAICLARMWGIAETLEPLPNKSFQEVRNMVMEWAEDYIAAQKPDLVNYFTEQRCRCNKREKYRTK